MRVGLVDDHPLVLAGLAFALEREGVRVVFQASNAADALEAVYTHQPDAVVIDVLLPDGTGIDVCARCSVRVNRVPVWVVLTTFDDALVIEAAARAGVRGLFSKECEPRDLVRALHVLVDDPEAVALPERTWPSLTDRERTVLRQLVDGASFPEAARRLGIAESTVKDYAARLYGKFGAADRSTLLERLGPLATRLIDHV